MRLNWQQKNKGPWPFLQQNETRTIAKINDDKKKKRD
jgi:hypothetical protein